MLRTSKEFWEGDLKLLIRNSAIQLGVKFLVAVAKNIRHPLYIGRLKVQLRNRKKFADQSNEFRSLF
jgi:hypothetical protein